MVLKQGQRILHRYIVGDLLGEGAMGQVFHGTHEQLDMPVAIKVLSLVQSEEASKRFLREARLMARVRHQNIVQILDFGQLPDDGLPCIVMEFLKGEPLDEILSARGALPWQEALTVITGILAGLDALHQQKILHRDLKPSNIVIASGRSKIPKLIDFGIAREAEDTDSRLTKTGAVIGSPAYMAPEQVMSAPLDERTDLYSAGLVLYEILTGNIPFGAADMSAVLRRLKDPAPTPQAPAGLPAIPAALSSVLGAVLVPDPADRPSSAGDLAKLLRGALTQMRTTGGTAAAPHRANPTSPPGPAPAARPQPQPSIANQQTVVPNAEPRVHSLPEGSVDAENKLGTGNQDAWNTSWSRIPEGSTASEGRRYLIAAKLPASRLQAREDRRWLAGLVMGHGRCFSIGTQLWFALQGETEDVLAARERAEGIVSVLNERYGDMARIEYDTVPEDFVITSASLVGAAPLPEALEQLIAQISQ